MDEDINTSFSKATIHNTLIYKLSGAAKLEAIRLKPSLVVVSLSSYSAGFRLLQLREWQSLVSLHPQSQWGLNLKVIRLGPPLLAVVVSFLYSVEFPFLQLYEWQALVSLVSSRGFLGSCEVH